MLERIIERDQLASLCDNLRKQGKRIVTTNGCFDILHIGHVRILEAARHLGDLLIVGINSDDSTRKLKGPTRPVNAELNRAEIIASLRCVDYVTIFNEDTPVEFLKLIKPNFHVKGSDYKVEDLAETPIVQDGGGKVIILPLIPGESTTSMIARMQKAKSEL